MAEPTDQQIDTLLSALDEIARDYDHYDYGLPMLDMGGEDQPLNKMRDAVLSWLSTRGVRAVEQPRHDDGSPAPEDTIAKCKRILAAVDVYHDQPTQATRSDLRHVIYAELERAAAGVPGTLEGKTK